MDEYEKRFIEKNFETIKSVLKNIDILLRRHDKDIEKLKNQHNKKD